ncbi:hypothetical protein RMATCC62417_01648 [Rhizopus microsporus]|nr:hypothetical protein RMATCC62417_01648 [Rhizopus microsporus]
MNYNREQMLNNLVLAIISTQNEIKNAGPVLDSIYLDRSAQYPVVEGTKNKSQFSWDLLRKLMKDVHGSLVDNVIFNATRDHITIFRLPALIREVKDKRQTENGKSFKDTDPQVKLTTIEALEEMAVPFIPLRACVGSWGANLVLRYYWVRNEKSRYFAASSNEQDRTAQENTAHGRGSHQPSSSASILHEERDESDDSGIW